MTKLTNWPVCQDWSDTQADKTLYYGPLPYSDGQWRLIRLGKADLSLCSAHRSFCLFCHAPSHFWSTGHFVGFAVSFEPRHDKTNKMSVRPAKTQISLGIRPVWSESSLSAWRNFGSLATHWAHSENWSDWADAQADLSLRWEHTHFVGFVMSWLILSLTARLWISHAVWAFKLSLWNAIIRQRFTCDVFHQLMRLIILKYICKPVQAKCWGLIAY